ncbi:MAG: AgmX/PglI C-terminal domain-containing protein [Bdellovibrionales bacterium]|nr:AgmX/PglI C-terminal domain-containing protein [Bdellovibrionales bacterium]NQZ18453.1 AgmX/PglI C-terminal domain-containing protein [Bdellovibrionales bacterium]
MEAKNIVLKNRNGKVIRTLQWDAGTAHVVRLKSTGRIQIVPSTTDLKKNKIDFELIKGNIRKSAILSYGISLGDYGRLEADRRNLRYQEGLHLVEDDSDHQYKITLQNTTLAHLAVIALIFIFAWGLSQFGKNEQETPIKVTQQEVQKVRQQHNQTVNVSRKKVVRKPRVVKNRTKKARKIKRNNRITKNRSRTRRNGRKTVNVSKVGALGLLGGKLSGSKSSAGAWASSKAKRGSGLSQNSRKGGSGRGLPGKGLISSPRGHSGKALGSGGYATRGRGGGKQGYGRMNTGGSGAAYTEPLSEEALIEGGLDRDQIASVINRHIGQVIYCYEKGLQTQPRLSGRVNVRFVIGQTGRVKTAQVANTSLGSKKVENCIIRKLTSWKFPKPYGNVNVNVTYPFVLKRVSQR